MTASCVIVIMTAKDGADAMGLALPAGADDFLRKPFDMACMKEKVQMLLGIPVSLPAANLGLTVSSGSLSWVTAQP